MTRTRGTVRIRRSSLRAAEPPRIIAGAVSHATLRLIAAPFLVIATAWLALAAPIGAQSTRKPSSQEESLEKAFALGVHALNEYPLTVDNVRKATAANMAFLQKMQDPTVRQHIHAVDKTAQTSLDDAIKQMEADAALSALTRGAGIAPRDFMNTLLAVQIGSFLASAHEEGDLTATGKENLAFMKAHSADIQALLKSQVAMEQARLAKQ